MTRAIKSKRSRLYALTARDSPTPYELSLFFINCTVKQSTRKPDATAIIDIVYHTNRMFCPENIIQKKPYNIVCMLYVLKQTYVYLHIKLLCTLYTNRTHQHVFGFLTTDTYSAPSDVILIPQLKKLSTSDFFFSNLVTDFYHIYYFPKGHLKKHPVSAGFCRQYYCAYHWSYLYSTF